jgi:hypothetical protein
MSARLLFATTLLLFCVTEASAAWTDAGYDSDWNDRDIPPYTMGALPEAQRCNASTKDYVAVCWLNNPRPESSYTPIWCAYKQVREGTPPDGTGLRGRVWVCK